MTKQDSEADAVLEKTRHLLRTTGLAAAAEALISVCQDKTAPAPAKATAAVAIARINGLMVDGAGAAPKKSAAEMSPEELTNALADLKRQLADRRGADLGDDDSGEETGVFD